MDLNKNKSLQGTAESRKSYFKSLLSLTKLFSVSASHPNTFKRYRSYAEIVVERRRQVIEGGDSIIHPYSLFSLYWNSTMVFVNIAHMICSSLRLCYILETDKGAKLHPIDWALLTMYFICYIDIFVKFHAGYNCDETNAVLTRRRIIWHYLRGWFAVDLVSCLPVAFILLNTKFYSLRYLLIGHLMPLIRMLRLFNVLQNLNTFMKIFTDSFIWLRIVRHILLLIFSAHCSSCTLYMLPILTYYWEGKMSNKYVLFLRLKDGDLTEVPSTERYMKALTITMSTLVGVNPSMLLVNTTEEFVVYALYVFYHAMLMLYTVVFLLQIYMTIYNSMIRFHGLMSQIEAYMQHKQLPAHLRKRLKQFYRYSFQEQYYKEDDTLACLSDQLRHEIILHTCHKLVNRLPLLEGLPESVVGAVLGCLRPEVYLPNDLVMRAGDDGQCMYFIANGTVAVYSLKGAEICHLEDGDHFGEVALLMRDSKRVATVVSVEITQVYRLDSSDFRLIVNSNKVLYDRLQSLASQRMHETVVLDDEFRRRREGGDLDNISFKTN